MEKRGISHVEVILSFVLFIVAVGAALYFFNPGSGSRLIESSLTYAFREISQNTSTKIETFSVVLNNDEITGNVIAINFSGIEGKTRVETYDGTVLESNNDGKLVHVSAASFVNIDFIFVKFGEEFDESTISGGAYNESYYAIGSSNIKEVISEKKFLELNESYYEDYAGLKGERKFNLPPRINFGFSLIFAESDLIAAEKNIPAGLEVYSETQRVEVLRKDGGVNFADLTVKVW